MNDYIYDVFFSYKRHPITEIWHDKVIETLNFWISQNLGRDVSIFYDKESIIVGDIWKQKIGTALKSSKCIVAILSPAYFNSKWCYAEIKSFLKRQDDLGLNGGIILGARFHDGNSFPPEISSIQQVDFNNYNNVSPMYWETREAVEFYNELSTFSASIADRIRNVPPFNSNFPIIDPESIEISSPSIKRIV